MLKYKWLRKYYTSQNTHTSWSITIRTLDPDDTKYNIGTVGIDTGQTDNAHHVYQTRDSLATIPWSVGQEQPQEELQHDIEQQESTSRRNELRKKHAHRSFHHSTSKMDKSRNNHRVHLQQQQVLHQADLQHTSRKLFNMINTLGSQHQTVGILNTTDLDNYRRITKNVSDPTVQEG